MTLMSKYNKSCVICLGNVGAEMPKFEDLMRLYKVNMGADIYVIYGTKAQRRTCRL